MTAPLPLPMRVLVKGASQVVWTSWMGGPRTDFAYPRVIEAELYAAGRPAEVRVEAFPSARTSEALKTWEQEVVRWSPDVVVLHYGQFEVVHLLLPWWMEVHAFSIKTRPGPVRDKYRFVLDKVWKSMAQVQKFVDRRVNQTVFSNRPRRVGADLERLITQIRSVASPLVIVPDFIDPCTRYADWFPGMRARTQVMNQTIDDLIAKINHPDVRRFSVREVVAGMDLEDEPAPDGGHYTPEVHREVGRALTSVILEWASNQPHLKTST
jgi:hypothetical protein